MTSKLYQPIQLGDMYLSHRVALAPQTRRRADYSTAVPIVPLVAEYYEQRASIPGTFLVTEATFIHQRAGGISHVPGIWSDEQIEAWSEVTRRVHAKGSFIFMQLWALGRAADAKELGGWPVVSSSSIALSSRPSDIPPRPLSTSEIIEYVDLYRQAAYNAVHLAAFDGIEVHGANGYLPDQFLQDMCNKRTDEYGGSIENRCKFTLEIVRACIDAVGPHKVGLRISPWHTFQDMGMENPGPTFFHLVQELTKRHPEMAYLHVVEPRVRGRIIHAEVDVPEQYLEQLDTIRKLWNGGKRIFLSAGGYTRRLAEDAADKNGDIIVFGRAFIANPDLPVQLRERIPLNIFNPKTCYFPGSLDPLGYTDYPAASEPHTLSSQARL
ncbi:hypothetical protein DL96DRAFT_1616488 [Flagelloscypha sp. PMI_526]|nr:hypothetical protein DL96DRAFT_1616488 [Flagelloscypha sp. PMI_526]